MEESDWPRARQYFDWAVSCRPDSPRIHEGLGVITSWRSVTRAPRPSRTKRPCAWSRSPTSLGRNLHVWAVRGGDFA